MLCCAFHALSHIDQLSAVQGHLQPSRFGDSIEAFIGPEGARAGEEVARHSALHRHTRRPVLCVPS